TSRCSHGRHSQGERLAHPSLERAKRTLPNVSAENHEDDWLAQSPHSMEVKRWFRHSRKPSASSSQLPPATPQPGFTRGETASCKGRLGRLELLDAKVSRAVLRGRDDGNIILLPDTDVRDSEWLAERSEERRVGKKWRCGWSRCE